MSLVKRDDREALGSARAAFSLLAVVLACGALFIAAANFNRETGAPIGAVPVSLSEFAISPASISVPVGGKLAVGNSGSIEHNLRLSGTKLHTKNLKGGESAVLDLKGVKAGTYEVFCEVPGHKSSGMTATLVVGNASGAAAGTHDMSNMSPEQMAAMNDASDATMKKPVDAYVAQLTKGANTKGVGNQPLAPKVQADGTKEFDLTASIIDWEVSPGKTVKAWAYNGQVPGPWIKVDVGDKVRVVLDNQLPQSTAIHFHGIEVPFAMDGVPDVTQTAGQARRRSSPTSSSPRVPRWACTTRTTTRSTRCPTDCSASSRSATCRCRPAPAPSPSRSRWC